MKVLLFPTSYSELDSGSTQNVWVGVVWVGLDFEEVVEKSDGWGDSKECFAKMDKKSDMQNRIGVEMIQLETIEEQQAMKERRSGQAKTMPNEGGE
jgi:hypothetical protein